MMSLLFMNSKKLKSNRFPAMMSKKFIKGKLVCLQKKGFQFPLSKAVGRFRLTRSLNSFRKTHIFVRKLSWDDSPKEKYQGQLRSLAVIGRQNCVKTVLNRDLLTKMNLGSLTPYITR